MKKLILLVLLVFSISHAWSQNSNGPSGRNSRIPLIGEKAPSFIGQSTSGVIRFPGEFGRSWKILFSHPQDFTPVCTTEIMELAQLHAQFSQLGVQLVVISTDSLYRHSHWKESMEGVRIGNREPAKINFPLVADPNLSISRQYGMIHAATNTTEAVRGVFIINPDDIIESISFYPMQVGRSTDEILRLVSALQESYTSKMSTPVNWKPGGDLLVRSNPRTDLSNPDVLPAGYYSPIWYLTFKKAEK